MRPVFVDQLEDRDGCRRGAAVFWETVSKNLRVLFDGTIVDSLLHKVKTEPDDPFYFFHRYGQLVVQVSYERPEGLLMRFTDYHGNTNAVLDDYAPPAYNGLDADAMSQVMALMHDIEQHPNGQASMERIMVL